VLCFRNLTRGFFMTEIATSEPLSFRAGDKVQWQKSFDDYPASESYVLKYYLVISGTNLITITAAASGDNHLVTIPAATSANYAVGRHSYQARIEKDTEKHTVGTGIIEVLADLSADATGADYRSHAKKTLDALEATILGKASSDQLSYSIAGRSLSKFSPEELISWRKIYRAEYLREERIAGRTRPQKIKVQFP
jgi:hypothetical protein